MLAHINDFFASLPPWLGTIPGWFTSVGTIGILGLLLRSQIENRRITVQAEKNEDDLDDKLKTHFKGELERLTTAAETAEKRALAAVEEIEAAKERQRKCEEREERLRKRVRHLEDKLTGIVRSLSVEGSLRILDLTEHPSEDIIRAAINSLEHILTKSPNVKPEGEEK